MAPVESNGAFARAEPGRPAASRDASGARKKVAQNDAAIRFMDISPVSLPDNRPRSLEPYGPPSLDSCLSGITAVSQTTRGNTPRKLTLLFQLSQRAGTRKQGIPMFRER